jgi:hypothetical protein
MQTSFFEQKFHWISPCLLAGYVLLTYFIIEIMIPQLKEQPFPWCCSENQDSEQCKEKLSILSSNLISINKLHVW